MWRTRLCVAMADHTIPLFHGGHNDDGDDDGDDGEGDDDDGLHDNDFLYDCKNGVSMPKGNECAPTYVCC